MTEPIYCCEEEVELLAQIHMYTSLHDKCVEDRNKLIVRGLKPGHINRVYSVQWRKISDDLEKKLQSLFSELEKVRDKYR